MNLLISKDLCLPITIMHSGCFFWKTVFIIGYITLYFCLFSLAESAQQKSIRKAIVEIFNIDSRSLQEWLHCEVVSDFDNEAVKSYQALAALQKFVSCAIEEKEYAFLYLIYVFTTSKAQLSSTACSALFPFVFKACAKTRVVPYFLCFQGL